MTILVLQHSDIGGPGRLGATLRDHGFKLDVRRPDKFGTDSVKGVPADLDNVQAVVVLGGPMNVTDIATLPWMQAEAKLIVEARAAELPVIGICLGAQLIAHALGGEVGKREKPAVGLLPVVLNITGQTETMLSGIPWNHVGLFSCGQEVKKLPPGATLLASTKQTPVQVFRAGLRTYGFMQHFECDKPMAEALLGSERRMVEESGGTPGELKAQLDQGYEGMARLGDRLCVNIVNYCFQERRKQGA